MRSEIAWAGGIVMLVGTACASGGVTPAMVTAAQKRWPDASREGLERGQTLFASKCGDCHALPSPRAHAADAWPAIVGKMGKLAGLDAAASESVLRYVTAAREAE